MIESNHQKFPELELSSAAHYSNFRSNVVGITLIICCLLCCAVLCCGPESANEDNTQLSLACCSLLCAVYLILKLFFALIFVTQFSFAAEKLSKLRPQKLSHSSLRRLLLLLLLLLCGVYIFLAQNRSATKLSRLRALLQLS